MKVTADEPFQQFKARQRFDSLDGLRAISVLAVVWHHTAGRSFQGTWLAVAGSEGVSLFFAISGFLITTLLVRERERHGRIDLRAFYVRRTLRIFPLYYGVLLLYCLLTFLLERHSAAGQQFFKNLVYFATHTSNWFVQLEERTIFYIAWSIAAEEQFYLLWPPLLILLGTSTRALQWLLAVIAVLLLLDWFVKPDHSRAGSVLWFVYKVPLAILLGAAGALALNSRRGFALLHTVLGGYWSCLVLAVLLVGALAWNGLPRSITHLACALLVLSTCLPQRYALQRILNIRILVYIGSISYGIYLLHVLAGRFATKVLGAAGIGTPWPVVFVATTVGAVICAGLSFRFFESRFLAMKVRFER